MPFPLHRLRASAPPAPQENPEDITDPAARQAAEKKQTLNRNAEQLTELSAKLRQEFQVAIDHFTEVKNNPDSTPEQIEQAEIAAQHKLTPAFIAAKRREEALFDASVANSRSAEHN